MSTKKRERTQIEEKYHAKALPELMAAFHYKNSMQVPRLSKIVVNTCIKAATTDKKILDKALEDLTRLIGQKPLITRAKKAISNFKLKENQPIGCCVTLRRKNMYDFFNRLVNVALPRVRDFKGVSPKSFDGLGNYTMGIVEHTIFPEISTDAVENIFGMSVTFVTTAKTDPEAHALLRALGMPFREQNKES